MPVMEQQNNAFRLKYCRTKILEEDYLLVVAGKTLAAIVVVVIAIVVPCFT